jgi:hypothetical protein
MFCRFVSFASIFFAAVWLFPADATAADTVVATVLTGLKSPSGVAIRPDGTATDYEILVSDAGAGQVLRIRNGQSERRDDAINGFASQAADDEPFPTTGPHGLLFLDSTRLVVVGGEGKRGAFVRLYDLAGQPTEIAAEKYEQTIEPTLESAGAIAEVQLFHNVARTSANEKVPDLLILTGLDNTGKAGVWKLPVRAGTFGQLKRVESDGAEKTSDLGGAVAVGEHGYVVISRSAEKGAAASRLVFLNPINNDVAMELTARPSAILGIAYSPVSGNLYAAVFAGQDSQQSGIYRIDAASEPGQPACELSKVADAEHPSALAFAVDGTLYVTALGEPSESESTTGKLLKITGDL